MKIAVIYGPRFLSHRGSLDFHEDPRKDPRGLTGSEYGVIRIAEEAAKAGHDVTLYTVSAEESWAGFKIADFNTLSEFEGDAAIAVNDPDALRDVKAKVRVCEQWVNDFTYCAVGFDEHVDLFTSPSKPHLDKVFSGDWSKVALQPDGTALGTFKADRKKWSVNLLGCDPPTEKSASWRIGKMPGRVIYCSSPDRGLHWLLQEWLEIRKAVPNATLKIFYRLEAWANGFLQTPFFPPVESQRDRAVYIVEMARRLKDFGVEVCDATSREQLELEMAAAEVLAYPCDTTTWSEGFSCTILESCAFRACPVITDCDALKQIYGKLLPMAKRGEWTAWRGLVINALKDAQFRLNTNNRAQKLAEELTWTAHVQRLLRQIEGRLSPKTSGTRRAASRTSAKKPAAPLRSSTRKPARTVRTTGTRRTGTTSTS